MRRQRLEGGSIQVSGQTPPKTQQHKHFSGWLCKLVTFSNAVGTTGHSVMTSEKQKMALNLIQEAMALPGSQREGSLLPCLQPTISVRPHILALLSHRPGFSECRVCPAASRVDPGITAQERPLTSGVTFSGVANKLLSPIKFH